VNFLRDLSENSLTSVCEQVARVRRPGDIVVVSIHWGPNWAYEIWDDQVRFARALIDRADVTVVHGHSSHHAKAIEVYRNRLILYGCGDFLNDYEGISGYEEFRDDLALMYFADIGRGSRDLVALDIVPLQIRQFRLVRASRADAAWLQGMLDRECQKCATRVPLTAEGRLAVSW
jgi:poly-gamma-glutamate synthesis protein (capsule biosynthesis protein)